MASHRDSGLVAVWGDPADGLDAQPAPSKDAAAKNTNNFFM